MNAEVIPSAFPSIQDEVAANQSIGDIIRRANNLSADEIDRILDYQRQHGVKFGEAAVALGLAQQEDVLWALAQQFHYPYAGRSSAALSEELVIASKPFCDQSEIFRSIRDQLTTNVYQSGEPKRRAVAVLSPDSGDGKSFFVANMAVALAQLGGRTLLIDADMRSPRQHEIFKVDNASGLSGILAGRSEGNVLRHVQDYPGLYVLPVGIVPPNPLELLQRPSFGMLISELTSKFDHVIIDTPSGSQGVDNRVIGVHAGAVLAVARQGKTRTEALNLLLNPLMARTSVKMLGVVINEF